MLSTDSPDRYFTTPASSLLFGSKLSATHYILTFANSFEKYLLNPMHTVTTFPHSVLFWDTPIIYKSPPPMQVKENSDEDKPHQTALFLESKKVQEQFLLL